MNLLLFSAHPEPVQGAVEGTDLRAQQDIWDGEGAHLTVRRFRLPPCTGAPGQAEALAAIRAERFRLAPALLLIGLAVLGFALVMP